MMGDRTKKPRTEENEEAGSVVDKELFASVEKLQEVQDELEKVNEEASEKVLEIEQKYNEIRKPVYVKRNEIIRSIPDFWLTSFLSHPVLCELLNPEDQKIFKYLDSIDVEDDLKMGFSIIFNFKPNPFFEDTKLAKTIKFSDEGTTKIIGANIKWKDGMGSVNGTKDEKKGNKRAPPSESFFSWLSETQPEDLVEMHDEVAEMIKEDLWPNPIKYFNNEGEEEDDSEEEEEEDGEEGEEVIEEEEEEDANEDEDSSDDDA